MELNGRVLEVRAGRDGTTLVVVAGGETRTLQVTTPCDIAPGALVRVRLDERGEVQVVERVAGPDGPWNDAGDATRWVKSTAAGSRAQLLWRRQAAFRAIREDLFGQGFLEVDTPLLVPSTCPDAVMDSVETTDGRYLITSSEYQLKRMMVGGFDRVFSLTKNFRAGDRGRLHSPEFTMIEWARCWQSLQDIEGDAERFARKAFRAVHGPSATESVVHGHRVVWDGEPWERVDLRDALQQRLGVAVDETFSLPSLVQGAQRAQVPVPESFQESPHLVMSWLLDALQPHLGHPLPTFLRGWPAFLTSSAEIDPQRPGFALRSELYVAGIEIADGFGFLRDAAAQRESFARESRRREQSGRRPVRIDERYVEAIAQGIPPGAGMALGVDRLVMALTDAPDIAHVLAFAEDEL
jgi:elongation factor P--(R)-beta-lysine ligase